MNLTRKKLLKTAINAVNELEFSEYEHEAILQYLDIDEEEYEEIMNTPDNEKHYVYLIQIQYSTDDYDGVDTFLFENREKAISKLHKLIEIEKQTAWIQDAYEQDGLLNNDYELDDNLEDSDSCSLWWNFKCLSNYNYHTFIDLREIEVQ